ncbi:hypothetical protein [Polyangium aurulentum]|uniref:hypothetical protein n=1 Tax=Polyangium aurulentum TaxID=2567896 RepID=UPI0010AE6A31|nr:hypothetical protein [Polyangium aurulentum]UQA57294.1 hypothetical protein E8A73_039350 [Polyangium aurulentum]
MQITPSRPRANRFSGRAAAIVAAAATATLASACTDYELQTTCGTADAPACTGAPLWIEAILGDEGALDPNNKEYGEQVRALAVDESGGVVAAGFGNGSLLFGAPLGAQLLLATYEASGSERQPPRFVGEGNVYADGVGVDAKGNLLLAGTVEGPLNFEQCALDPEGADGFLARLDSKSSCAAIRSFPGIERQDVRALGVGPDGNAAVAGKYTHIIDLDGDQFMVQGGHDSFVAALDDKHLVRWSTILGGEGAAEVTGVAVMRDGDVVITGWFTQTLVIGGETYTSAGTEDLFVARLSGNDGKVKWFRFHGDGYPQIPTSIAAGPEGQIAVAGRFRGAIKLTGVVLENMDAVYDDGFVMHLDANGNAVWGKTLSGGNQQVANAVAIDPVGDVIVAGSFSERITINSRSHEAPAANAEEAFVVKLGAKDGATVWSRPLGGLDYQAALAVAVDELGAPYVGGSFKDTMTVKEGMIVESADRRRGFVLKLAP